MKEPGAPAELTVQGCWCTGNRTQRGKRRTARRQGSEKMVYYGTSAASAEYPPKAEHGDAASKAFFVQAVFRDGPGLWAVTGPLGRERPQGTFLRLAQWALWGQGSFLHTGIY